MEQSIILCGKVQTHNPLFLPPLLISSSFHTATACYSGNAKQLDDFLAVGFYVFLYIVIQRFETIPTVAAGKLFYEQLTTDRGRGG